MNCRTINMPNSQRARITAILLKTAGMRRNGVAEAVGLATDRVGFVTEHKYRIGIEPGGYYIKLLSGYGDGYDFVDTGQILTVE